MKISCLTENTAKNEHFCAEHGLSLYIEAGSHKILFDAGQTDVFEKNAATLGIDLADVDMAVLSHGHYDHSGGLLRFLELNDKAKIYVNENAMGAHYNGTEKYIGMDKRLLSSPRVILVGDEMKVDKGLTLYSCNGKEKQEPINSFGLNVLREGAFEPDDFRHEQYLLIEEGGKRILISGCSHKGILNIENWFSPDVLVGGFHLMKLDPEKPVDAARLTEIGNSLNAYPTMYYTGHCTGVPQYEFLSRVMKENLRYLPAGETLYL